MNRRIAEISLLLGIAIALGACASVKVSEDDQPLAERVARMRQGPGITTSIDFPDAPVKREAE